MKKSGVIRKIDTLGRIVIPIGIRKQLRIKTDETLQISIEDNKIVLEKYKALVELNDIVSKIISISNKAMNIDFAVTDNEKVINCSKEEYLNLKDKQISREYFDMLSTRKKQSDNNAVERSWIVGHSINTIKYIVPLIHEGVVIGSIFLIGARADENKKMLIDFISSIILLELSDV